MDEPDLLSEWISFPGLTGRHIRQLSDAGVTSAAWIMAGHIATPRITITGRFFMPDPFGTPAFVVPVYDGEPVSEINPDPSVPSLTCARSVSKNPNVGGFVSVFRTWYSARISLLPRCKCCELETFVRHRSHGSKPDATASARSIWPVISTKPNACESGSKAWRQQHERVVAARQPRLPLAAFEGA